MGKVRIFTEEEKKKFLDEYVSKNNRNLEKLSQVFKTSKIKLKSLLEELGVERVNGNKKYSKERTYQDVLNGYKERLEEGYVYVAICKKTNKEYKDYTNSSGSLFTHIKETYPERKLPSKFIRSSETLENNRFWHEQYFNIIQRPIRIKEEIKINEEDFINDYENGMSLANVSSKYKIGQLRGREILERKNVNIKNIGGPIKHGNYKEIQESSVIKYEANENELIFAKHKTTGVMFTDVNNRVSTLTKYLKSINTIDINECDNTYQIKKYELENGKKWYEVYFDIIRIPKPKTRKCKICGWETRDITNKSGYISTHLKKEHNIELEEYLISYPEDVIFHPVYIKNEERKKDLADDDKSVVCQICGEKFRSISFTHLLQHNITPEKYKEKYGEDTLFSNQTMNKLSECLALGRENMVNNYTSTPHEEIRDYIISLGLICEDNNRKFIDHKTEIDILIHSEKLGIEYDGIYWHCERFGKNSSYHLNKTKLMNNKDYNLLHIFEDEWKNKREIVLSKIRHKLGFNVGERIGARKCKIEEIDKKIKDEFLNDNDINGTDESHIKIGAFYNDELVALMSFINKNTYWELSRFCVKNDIVISGIGSRLLKQFINYYNPSSIIGFADRRWSFPNNTIYEKLGFKFIKKVPPTFYYYKNGKVRLEKSLFTKEILIKKYGADKDKDEWLIMQEMGYDRIWDCGLFKYELKIK